MNCQCKKDIEARLLEGFKEENPSRENHTVELKGYALVFGKTVELKPFMSIETTYAVTSKNGNVRIKKGEQKMLFSHCPFCGTAINKAEAA